MTRRLILVFAALALFTAACGDDDDAAVDDADDGAAQTDDPVVDEDADGGDTGGDSDVTIQDFTFEPDSIEVSAGTTVTFTNADGVNHTVTSGADSESDGTFDEPADSGDTAELTVDEPGTYPYFCAIHPTMTGEIVVS